MTKEEVQEVIELEFVGTVPAKPLLFVPHCSAPLEMVKYQHFIP